MSTNEETIIIDDGTDKTLIVSALNYLVKMMFDTDCSALDLNYKIKGTNIGLRVSLISIDGQPIEQVKP